MQHVRLSFVTADPARLGDVVHYLEQKTRPLVEGRPGSLGMSLQVDSELGTAVVESHWVSHDAMKEDERAVVPAYEEAVRRGGGTLSAEQFEVASFVQEKRPQPGAGVRVTRSDVEAVSVDDAIANYEDAVLPWLLESDGFCGAVLFVHRRARRAVNATVWRDAAALAASRGPAAEIRADAVAATSAAIRALEEYLLVFSSARPA